MTTREKILSQIKINKPVPSVLPDSLTFKSDFSDKKEVFTEMLASVYTQVISVKNEEELYEKVLALYPDDVNRATTVERLLPWADFSLSVENPHDLEMVELAILKAEFGVAENGAIWISDNHLPHRVLPFITQNLAFVIPESSLVNNMHDAYNRLQDTTGWGCFISGPSKTADIEQSLVIGAHGARSLVVFLVGDM